MKRLTYCTSIAAVLIWGLFGCSSQLAPEEVRDTSFGTPVVMLSDPCGKPIQVTLWTHRSIDAGYVSVSNDANTITLDILIADGWLMAASQVAVARIPRELPQTRSGNPRVGHFDLKTKHKPLASSFTYEFDCAEDDFQPGDEIVFAVHVVLYRIENGLPVRRTGAWAGELDFPGRSWATYFLYVVQDCPPPPPPPGSCEVTVMYPNGGEMLQVGNIHTITWDYDEEACGAQVSIDLLWYGDYWLTIAEAAPNAGLFDWEVASGNVDGDGFAIQVVDLESGAFDESDNTFSIQEFSSPKQTP